MRTLFKILYELSGLDEDIIWTVDAFYSRTQVLNKQFTIIYK